MNVDEAIQRLEAAGLVISHRFRLRSDSEESFLIASSPRPDGDLSQWMSCVSGVWHEKGQWVFNYWHSMPGPAPDDFRYKNKDLERIIALALDFYFGEPIVIDGWILPVHKHPEWSRERLPIVVKTARRIDPDEWRVIHEASIQCRLALYPHGTLDEIFACVFNPIAHSEANLTLWLRRDLGEAFIVEGRYEY